MKKIICLVFMLVMCLSISVCFASATGSQGTQNKMNKQTSNTVKADSKSSNLPKVAVIYLNNAKTTYDKDIDRLILRNISNCLPSNKHIHVDGAPYVKELAQNGIVDLTTAERQDIIDAFSNNDVSYVIYVEVQPLVTKDRLTFFTVGKDITAIVPFKIIDLSNNKYLYNGKFTEKARDSTILGDIGNKSVSITAINKINDQIRSVLKARLPENKPAKHI